MVYLGYWRSFSADRLYCIIASKWPSWCLFRVACVDFHRKL